MNSAELPQIGQPFAGGFYAGLVLVGLENYAIIVAPKKLGEGSFAWGERGKISAATSYSDGKHNTAAMAEIGSLAAQWAAGLTINNFNDWYIPARDELEILYRNLKPTTNENCCSFRDGDNPSAPDIANRYPYTPNAPAITKADIFKNEGAEAFDTVWHWSSTQDSARYAWVTTFEGGSQGTGYKDYTCAVRAVRRELVI